MNQGDVSQSICPRCDTKLENVQIKYGMVLSCFNCKGRGIGFGLLKKVSDPALIRQVWTRAKNENNATGAPCPVCRRSMLVVTTGPQLGSVELDVCSTCFIIWFDHQELEKVPKASNAEIAKRSAATAQKKIKWSWVRRRSYGYDYDDGGLSDIANFLKNWINGRY